VLFRSSGGSYGNGNGGFGHAFAVRLPSADAIFIEVQIYRHKHIFKSGVQLLAQDRTKLGKIF
jgi:hypothetical protein